MKFSILIIVITAIGCPPLLMGNDEKHDNNKQTFERGIYCVTKSTAIGLSAINLSIIFSTPLITDKMISEDIHTFYGSWWCHQKYERSFIYNKNKMPLCARCTGQSVGHLFGHLNTLWWNPLNPPHTISPEKSVIYCLLHSLLVIPMTIDGFIQLKTDYTSSNPTRFVTGFLYGYALTAIIEEIIRLVLFSEKKK